MYQREDSQEQVVSAYGDVSDMDTALMTRTQANYSAEVTMCDRWFGYFMESLRVLGLLDNTLLIFTSDHGHSIGDRHHLGKRGYPSTPETVDVPLMVRFPGADHAGTTSDMFVQHHDITAVLLEAAKVEPPEKLDGVSFIEDAITGKPGRRDHVTVGWGSAVTVVTDAWWFNCKADGTGVLLYDLTSAGGHDPFATNVADEHAEVVNELFSLAVEDAGGSFPDWIIELAKDQADVPGCSDLVARL
jgi:arylsulfatase A-like enzyme